MFKVREHRTCAQKPDLSVYATEQCTLCTLLQVVGFLAAWRARVPCVVVTTTVRGRDSLAAKARRTREQCLSVLFSSRVDKCSSARLRFSRSVAVRSCCSWRLLRSAPTSTMPTLALSSSQAAAPSPPPASRTAESRERSSSSARGGGGSPWAQGLS